MNLMPPPSSSDPPNRTRHPLEAAILFVDLVNSSDFATALGLREYAGYVDAFEELCQRQCEHFFKTYHEGEYQPGKNYSWEFSGDELVVFMHTDRPANDVYQLVCLAITLKCGWLARPRMPSGSRPGFLPPIWRGRSHWHGLGYSARQWLPPSRRRHFNRQANRNCFAGRRPFSHLRQRPRIQAHQP